MRVARGWPGGRSEQNAARFIIGEPPPPHGAYKGRMISPKGLDVDLLLRGKGGKRDEKRDHFRACIERNRCAAVDDLGDPVDPEKPPHFGSPAA